MIIQAGGGCAPRQTALDKRAAAPYKGASRRGPAPAALPTDIAGGLVRKKKPIDPVRREQKNRAYRIGWLIAFAGIACGFLLVALKG